MAWSGRVVVGLVLEEQARVDRVEGLPVDRDRPPAGRLVTGFVPTFHSFLNMHAVATDEAPGEAGVALSHSRIRTKRQRRQALTAMT